MKHKRNRSNDEKIAEVLDVKISNLHPDLRERLFAECQKRPEASNVVKCLRYLRKILSLPENGKPTQKYWLARGWNEGEAYVNSQKYVQKNKVSPYSKEFWLSRINPKTGINYTVEEADFERNSRRPIRPEYWIKKGYSPQEAQKIADEKKTQNNKSGSKTRLKKGIFEYTSKRCIEYWTSRGSTVEEAKEKISKLQETFSLRICIEKYGKKEGRKRWLERQELWHKSYKKSNFSKVSQELFWSIASNLSNLDGIYFAQLADDKKKDDSGINHEVRLKLEDSLCLPDFIDIHQKKIIEFNGSYWHGKVGRGNKTRHKAKLKKYYQAGYVVLEIDEKEYYADKDGTVKKCVTFLKT